MGDLENARAVAISYLTGGPRPPRLRSLIDVDGDLYAYQDRETKGFPYVLKGARTAEYETVLTPDFRYGFPWWCRDVDCKNLRAITAALYQDGWSLWKNSRSMPEYRIVKTMLLYRGESQAYVVWVKFIERKP